MNWLGFYIRTTGRISRRAIWLAIVLPMIALTFAAEGLDEFVVGERVFKFANQDYGPFGLTVSLLLIWPGVATSIRRFHDWGSTGWWVLPSLPMMFWWPTGTDFSGVLTGPIEKQIWMVFWSLCAGISMVLGLAQLFVPGARGDNRFGADPLKN